MNSMKKYNGLGTEDLSHEEWRLRWPKPDQQITKILPMLKEMIEIFSILEEEKISISDVLKVVQDARARRILANRIAHLVAAIDMG